jgi:hypothetical protein
LPSEVLLAVCSKKILEAHEEVADHGAFRFAQDVREELFIARPVKRTTDLVEKQERLIKAAETTLEISSKCSEIRLSPVTLRLANPGDRGIRSKERPLGYGSPVAKNADVWRVVASQAVGERIESGVLPRETRQA